MKTQDLMMMKIELGEVYKEASEAFKEISPIPNDPSISAIRLSFASTGVLTGNLMRLIDHLIDREDVSL